MDKNEDQEYIKDTDETKSEDNTLRHRKNEKTHSNHNEDAPKIIERRNSNTATSLKPSAFEKYYQISSLVAIISIVTILVIAADECRQCFYKLETGENIPKTKVAFKKFWAFGRNNVEGGHLKEVFTVLERLGYQHEANGTDWDLLWAHDYPFRTLYPELSHLKPYQKVNHFPGCGYITNKVDLATSDLKYIPPAFKLPKDKDKLLEYSRKHPNKTFVQKNNDHRNIQIQKLEDINLNEEGTFIQEYVDKPLLVNGHRFDIGIYTVITSIDPLRVYIYNGEGLLRFCPDKYYPFDPSNLNKYVVGDDYLPTWEVPDLKYYYNKLGFGMRESLNAHLRSQGRDPSVIWAQIEDAVRRVILAKEPLIVNVLKRFCPDKYYPFDPSNLNKYVVGDDYLPTWEVPDLKYYYNKLGFGMRESLNAHLRSQGRDPSVIWAQIEDAVRRVILAKEPLIVNVLKRFKYKRNFFEMMRFDFVIDEDLNIFLLEANMSPNLSSAHFPPNRLLYQQVLYNIFGLVGVGERVYRSSLGQRNHEDQMIVSDKHLAVFPEKCNSPLCQSSCVSPECQLCKPCLSTDTRQDLIEAFKEHLHKGDCKRVFPPSMTQKEAEALQIDEKYSAENQLHYRWFRGKCLLDPSWC